MKNILFLVVMMLLIGWGSSPRAQADDPKNAEIFCQSLLQKNIKFSESDYSTYFSSSFRKSVTLSKLLSVFSDLNQTVGDCTRFSVVSQGAAGRFILNLFSQSGLKVKFSLNVEASSGLFAGLLLEGVDNPDLVIQSWKDVGPALKSLDMGGKLGATLKTSDQKIHLAYAEDQVFAIGSTFKLYVLGALHNAIERSQHAWDEKLAIRDEWKSLPSGTMQNLPVGEQVSLLDFATNMISISDNTAADHLLYFLGREEVQAMLIPMGNSHAVLNIPFMSTLEMFKLKWAIDPKQTQEYIASDAATRLQDLLALSTVDRIAVGTNGVSLSQPTEISTLEWFGSTDDNCNAMLWLASQNSVELRQVLSKSVALLSGIGQPESHWAYAGYKGGSEPGVLSMTFLLESKKGAQGCLSMSWNNDRKPVSLALFMDVVGKTLKFAETQIP